MNHIATAEPSTPGVNYSLLIMEAAMAVKMAVETAVEMAPGAIPRPGRVPEQRLLSPESRLQRRRRYRTLRGFLLGGIGFPCDGEYMSGRARSVDARCTHTCLGAARGGHDRYQHPQA